MWYCSVKTGMRMPDEGNRPDLQVINKREEKIDVVEMACPNWCNRAETDERKTRKYTTVREELKERHPEYEVRQTNIVIDILGGFDRGLMDELNNIISKVAAKQALEAMQKTILLHAIQARRKQYRVDPTKIGLSAKGAGTVEGSGGMLPREILKCSFSKIHIWHILREN